MNTQKRFMIIDGNALVHRAYHALPPLMAKDGTVVNAVYGFAMILMKALKDIKPMYAVVAFDRSEPTFRHNEYKEYKATREKKAQDLYDQIPLIQDMVRAFGIPTIDEAGFEADDIIATLSSAASKEKIKSVILTGDMDTLQLVDDQTNVWSFRKGMSDVMVYDRAAVKEKMGITPIQTIDYKALRGDTSDNIKGVPGIGEKTATELIKEFGSIEKLYEALETDEADSIRPRVRDILLQEKKAAFQSKHLVTLVRDVPIETNLEHYRMTGANTAKLHELFNLYGFRSLVKRIDEMNRGEQGSLLPSSATAKEDTAPTLPPCIGISLDSGTIGHDLKEYIKLKALSYKLTPPLFDTFIASLLLHSNSRQHDLETIAREYMIEETKAEDILKSLVPKMRAALEKDGLQFVADSIEMPLIPVLAHMEKLGIAVDVPYLESLTKEFSAELTRLEKKIWKMAGMEFNVSSPTQMREVLFEKMQLAPETGRIKKTSRGGVASTAAGELEKLRGSHPIIEEIFSHRELAKLKSTYTEALVELVNKDDGRIHTTFNQIGASTGRMSSSNPNLQNIPIRSENGQRIRKAFVAAPGFTLVSADYSQIELRVAASLSGDPRMIEAFQSGEDFHAKTAALMFDVATDKVTPNQRRDAKAINFGILYGMGAQSLSVGTGMARKDAEQFIARYFTIFKTLGEYLQDLKDQAKALGYVSTLFGRRRYIPEITSQIQQVRAAAERMAINMPIQGTATGDLMKLAMIKLAKEVVTDDVRMLLQVHDELVFEIKKDLVKDVAPQIKKIMEDVHHFKVPIVADLKSGPNWGEMRKIE